MLDESHHEPQARETLTMLFALSRCLRGRRRNRRRAPLGRRQPPSSTQHHIYKRMKELETGEGNDHDTADYPLTKKCYLSLRNLYIRFFFNRHCHFFFSPLSYPLKSLQFMILKFSRFLIILAFLLVRTKKRSDVTLAIDFTPCSNMYA